MKELKYFLCTSEQVGKLAVLDDEDEDGTVFVISEVNSQQNAVGLCELDSPSDGEYRIIKYNEVPVYVLEPIDVLERVVEWK